MRRYFVPVAGLVRKVSFDGPLIPAAVSIWESCPTLGMAVLYLMVYKEQA